MLKVKLITFAVLLCLFGVAQEPKNAFPLFPEKDAPKRELSAALKRSFSKYEAPRLLDNELYTNFLYTKLKGFDYHNGDGTISRRDPSKIIFENGKYYVWYTRPPRNIPVVGPKFANDTFRAYHWDMSDVWYATSPDGYHWTEKGVAVKRGPKGRYDHRSVFTADILVFKGKYYLYYQAAGSLDQAVKMGNHPTLGGDFLPNVIGMSWADSPDGPWHAMDKPVLEVGADDAWDSNVVHDPSLIVRGGKIWLYYKSSPRTPYDYNNKGDVFARKYADISRAAVGVAIADKPEGPFAKSKYNPVIVSGHEVIVWPYKKGVCAILTEGPEANSIQYAEDGINFYPEKFGTKLPEAAGTYRGEGNFVDTDEQAGPGIKWGLMHMLGDWNYLERFDCDLSLEKGLKKDDEYRKLHEWMNSDKKWEE